MASLLAGVSCFQLTGDEKYLELPRNQINVIMSLGACVLGVPHKTATKATTANCIMNNAQNLLHFSYCFRGRFCNLPLLRVIFDRKLGDSHYC